MFGRRARKAMIRLIGGSVLVSSVPLNGWAAFYTYSQWATWDEFSRIAYIAGIVEAYVYAAPSDYGTFISDCLLSSHMDASQLTANVLAYATQNPTVQMHGIASITMTYLFITCPGTP